ncbi:MAG: NosD domain-containing protein [Candidatus Bathyarchaeota archaeon]|nr:NosD domain-containing protein [Candidatus Bathyarchaeum tardum]WGM88685.1 MAG: NosD domain-containing protein [Candidatus Bathyarchaeum tardum]
MNKLSLLVLIILLGSVWHISLNVEIVKAQGNAIYIRTDGTVEGTDKIQREGNVYTLLGNLRLERLPRADQDGIYVEKDNIVIDGAGFTVHADTRGIVLSERNNVTVKNVKIEIGGGYGIYLVDTSNCLIFNNTVTGDAYNLYLWRSTNNTIEKNTITNAFRGILIYDSSDNSILENLVTDGVVGIELKNCANNVLRNNQMRNNRANFEVSAYPTHKVVNDVDVSNTIDGLPIYYWLNEENRTVPSDAGCVVLINCTRITVKNLDLSQNGQGIKIFSTTNSTLIQNTMIGAGGRGIELVHSSNINIIENNVQNFSMGISLQESSHNFITKNSITQNSYAGIITESNSTENTISENEIASNDYGISERGGNNILSQNKITANDFGISVHSSNNKISDNIIYENNAMGIILDAGSNILTGNNVTDNKNYGIYVSSGNALRNNRMTNNRINFDVRGISFENDVDTSNLVDGKPIIYWVNQQNKIVPHEAGYVALVKCENITVQNLNLANNGDGIFLAFTNHSTITGNTITNNNNGIKFWGSSSNIIVGNNIRENGDGVFFSGAMFLNVFYYPSPNNIIYYNNFVDNENNVADVAEGAWWQDLTPAVNIWDNGSEGNYWSNYNGTDSNGDEIGESPYAINEKNHDNYPLMSPVNIFDAGIWEWIPYSVFVLSNSTVSDFSFSPENALIQFDVEDENGTIGFCRVMVPKGLLSTEGNWTVLVDGAFVTTTVNEDKTSTYLYFTYNHSNKTVEIIGIDAIPEFLSWIILPLFLGSAFVMVFFKKKNGFGEIK